MAWFGRSRNDDTLDRLELVAHDLEKDLRKVVVELSAVAAEQRVAADELRSVALERLHDSQEYDDREGG